MEVNILTIGFYPKCFEIVSSFIEVKLYDERWSKKRSQIIVIEIRTHKLVYFL